MVYQIKHISFQLIFLVGWICSISLNAAEKMCFATASDTEHYTWTLNLVAGIHRYHEQLGEIAVFDLGLKPMERAQLNSLAYVQVYDIEQTNPLMLQKFTVNNQGKIARGWYSWKPVAIKQAMDLFSEFFYLDSGITILGPMDSLFAQVHEKGYFLIDCGHSIERMTMKPLIEKFDLQASHNQWILKKKGISAGIQGLSRAVYTSYVMPVYEFSQDISNFADDGSCPKGFGWARHDQTLFSIQARLLKLKVNEVIRGGKFKLQNDHQIIKVNLDDFLRVTRGEFDLNQSKIFLKYKAGL